MSEAPAIPPATARERFAWCMFDFANSAFATLVVTFVYAAYFSKALSPERGDVQWSQALTVCGILIALLSPVLGARADQRRGGKKRWLVGLSLSCIAATAALTLPHRIDGAAADAAWVWIALSTFVVANVCFELLYVVYNAFLPELAPDEHMGRLSGKAWATGYAGGLLCLAVGLGVVGIEGTGYGPWLPTADGFNVRATNLLVAGWFLVFAMPAFLWLRDRNLSRASATEGGLRGTVREVIRTLGHLRSYPDMLRLLIAHLVYNDAVLAIIGLAAVYMDKTLGMGFADIMVTAIGLNVAAGLGSFVFGWVEDRVGARTAIVGSLVLLLAGAILAVAIPTATAFRVAATLVGLGLGPNQSASRSLMARFAPADRRAEFFGIFSLSGKATAWVGTAAFGLLRDLTGSQRVALAPLALMLAVGLVLMLGVDQARGEAQARAV